MSLSNFDFASMFVTTSAAICSKIASHPFDTIKVRLQTVPTVQHNGEPLYTGTLDCTKKIYNKEGIQGFYKGLGVSLVGYAPTLFIKTVGFSVGLRLLSNQNPNMFHIFCAGAFSGLCTSVIITPIERVKCLLQIQHGGITKYNGSIDCIEKLFREGGLNGLYKGLDATLLREIPASGFYFATVISILSIEDMWFKYDSFFWSAIAAGLTYWIVGIPFDVLKTRIQTTSDVTNKEVYENLMKTEGPVALYNGIVPAFIQVLVINRVFFSTIKFLSKYF